MQRLGYLIERRYLGRRCSRPPCLIEPPVPVQRVLGLPPGVGRPSVVADSLVELLRGSRRYELSDWLGNVRVVVSDARVPVRQGGVVLMYRAEVVGRRDYYSYGQDMGERRYSVVDAYRYSFNGKEDVGEQRWWQDYGARMYHRVLGRFMSADPLIVGEKRYAWLSSYQFASASPVWAVDRDGLEAFFIHGSFQSHNPFGEEVSVELMRIVGNSEGDWEFRWNGAWVPTASGRMGVIIRSYYARALVEHVIRTRDSLLRVGKISSEEPISLIGYSHGGNIAIQASRMLYEEYGYRVRVVTISTPAYHFQYGYTHSGLPVLIPHPENPAFAKGIESHYHIVHENDYIVHIAGGRRMYEGSRVTTNYLVSNTEVPLHGLFSPHMDILGKKEFALYLKGLPTMKGRSFRDDKGKGSSLRSRFEYELVPYSE